MSPPRVVSLSLLVVIATIWAVCMVVPGLWLMFSGARLWPQLRWPCLVGGTGAAAAGTFVFMVLVADRLLPMVGRRLSMWTVEMGMFLVFITSSFLSFVWVLASYGGALH